MFGMRTQLPTIKKNPSKWRSCAFESLLKVVHPEQKFKLVRCWCIWDGSLARLEMAFTMRLRSIRQVSFAVEGATGAAQGAAANVLASLGLPVTAEPKIDRRKYFLSPDQRNYVTNHRYCVHIAASGVLLGTKRLSEFRSYMDKLQLKDGPHDIPKYLLSSDGNSPHDDPERPDQCFHCL